MLRIEYASTPNTIQHTVTLQVEYDIIIASVGNGSPVNGYSDEECRASPTWKWRDRKSFCNDDTRENKILPKKGDFSPNISRVDMEHQYV